MEAAASTSLGPRHFQQLPLAWSSKPRPLRAMIGRTCGRGRMISSYKANFFVMQNILGILYKEQPHQNGVPPAAGNLPSTYPFQSFNSPGPPTSSQVHPPTCKLQAQFHSHDAAFLPALSCQCFYLVALFPAACCNLLNSNHLAINPPLLLCVQSNHL
ncbi:unnamed protein product [Eretmochelys imbricata]